MPFITTSDSVRIYYEESGQGEPLLLISGQSADHTYWNKIRDDFSDDYRVLVFDHRGTGRSDKPSEPPYTTPVFARDAIELLDELRVDRAHVYGHSMGGRIGQWIGIDYSRRLGALVLGGSTPGNAHGVPRTPEVDFRLSQASADPQKILEELGPLIVTKAWAEANPEGIEQMSQIRRTPEYVRKLHYQASEGHDSWDLLSTISVPTLIIHGSDDELNPVANARLLAKKVPGSKLHIVKGGRHAYMLDFREESARVVKSFLKEHSFQA